MNSRYSQQTFTFPEAKAGSIIEYKYSVKGARMRDWYLQTSIPVKYSKYEIDFPSGFELHLRPRCSLPYDSKDNSTNLRVIKTFIMHDIPALTDEAFMSCDEDYLQKIESWIIAINFGGRREPMLKSWSEVAKMLLEDEDFGKQLNKEIPRTADLDLELKKLSDPYAKMIAST